MKPSIYEENTLVFIARIWNGILAVVLTGWSVLLAFIAIKLAMQDAWAYSVIAAVFTLLFALGVVYKLNAIRRSETQSAGLDAFMTLLLFLGIDVNK